MAKNLSKTIPDLNSVASQTIRERTDRVLATIRPEDSSKSAALKAERSLEYLRRESEALLDRSSARSV